MRTSTKIKNMHSSYAALFMAGTHLLSILLQTLCGVFGEHTSCGRHSGSLVRSSCNLSAPLTPDLLFSVIQPSVFPFLHVPAAYSFFTAGNPRGFFPQGFSQMVSCELFSILLETRSPGRWTICRVTLKKHVQHQQTPRTADTSANLEIGLSPARSSNVSTLSRLGRICN